MPKEYILLNDILMAFQKELLKYKDPNKSMQTRANNVNKPANNGAVKKPAGTSAAKPAAQKTATNTVKKSTNTAVKK